MKTIGVILLCCFVVSSLGCITTSEDYKGYLAAHSAQYQNYKQEVNIFRLEGVEGQSIELKGVKALVVNMPAAQAPTPQQRENKEFSQVIGLLNTGLSIAGPIYGYKLMGDNMVKLATSVGNSAGHNKTYTDSFNSNSKNTITDSNNTNSKNTTTTTSTTDSNNTATNSNNTDSFNTPTTTTTNTTTTTTNTDSHNVADSNNPITNSNNPSTPTQTNTFNNTAPVTVTQ